MTLERDLRASNLALTFGFVDATQLRTGLKLLSEPGNNSDIVGILVQLGFIDESKRTRIEKALLHQETDTVGPAEIRSPLSDSDPDPRLPNERSVIMTLRKELDLDPPRVDLQHADPSSVASRILERPPTRYQFGKEVGKGGHGIVTLVYDSDIGRRVALKTLRSGQRATTKELERFIEEVQVTGQLEHPNIVPVHELGTLATGEVFFTMKLVEGRTLEQVIVGLRKGVATIRRTFNRNRLIYIIQSVCQGVGFAHAKGVVHRDLKPANIMLGDYGEVMVMDWGLAKMRGIPDRHSNDLVAVVTDRSRAESDETLAGTIKGTPAYMSPEQAMGRIDLIDERSDVYSIGVILYELLCYQRPHMGKDPMKVIRAVVREPIVPLCERAPHMAIPEELAAITMKCLKKNPRKRYETAMAVYDALDGFLEGTKRRKQAALKVEDGNNLARQYEATRRECAALNQQKIEASRGVNLWDKVQQKRALWALEEEYKAKEVESIDTLGEAINRYVQALGYDPENSQAKHGLAALYWSKFRDAEQQRDHKDVRYFRNLVELYDDGSYAKHLKGDGLLSVDSKPRGAVVELAAYEERDRTLTPVESRELGETPLEKIPVAMGSYLLTMKAPGMAPVVRPAFVGRRQHLLVRVQMYPDGIFDEDMLFVPGGPFIMGGDPHAFDSLERSLHHVPDFAIGRYPVTMEQYLEFINELAAEDAMMAQFRVPRQTGGIDPFFTRGPDGKYFMPAFDRQNNLLDARFPVFGVSWEDAVAFADWLSEREGVPYRLPTEAEWEKAARGVDGRFYPWGDRFDHAFCKTEESRKELARPEAIGSFPKDCSPYGVLDMAGGTREWCSDWFDEARGLRTVRGGAWNLGESYTRVCNRDGVGAQDVEINLGFRAVRELVIQKQEPDPSDDANQDSGVGD